ncbi:MAG: site-2 protease family protein [Candidatus Pacearchaeota archaeon]|nr:MAG: site-2 protease family protein [Candidatus Pacearchaeota archaeon]
MDAVYIYDIIFLVIVGSAIALFLYKNRKRVKVESKIFLMYRTKIGLRLMNWASKKFSSLWNVLSYVSITFGYFAMASVFILFYISIRMMTTLVSVPKIPPIMPLIPYLPQIFNLPLPPFYFTYWIVIISIVAVTHEFAHGVFARYYKIKIKSTGFGFLGPFLAAFVEPDEKSMARKSKKAQLSILSAGTFSNFIFAIIFLLVLQLFFIGCYEQAGIIGYMYAFGQVNVTDIEEIGNYSYEEFLNLSDKEIENITETLPVKVNNKTHYLRPELYSFLEQAKKEKIETMALYSDTPAIRANLSGAFQKIDDKEIESIEDVYETLRSYKPGDIIEIQTSEKNYLITLDEHPENSSRGYLGIGFPQISGIAVFLSSLTSPFFSPYIYAEPKYNPEILTFIYNLFFWLILICFSVALLNMLPLGILDGGKFIYITALTLTGSKKKAEIVYQIAAFMVLLIFLVLMLVWVSKVF